MQMVNIVTIDGASHTLSKESGELDFQYRTSPFQKMKHSAVIVGATFELVPDVDAKQRQRSYLERCRPLYKYPGFMKKFVSLQVVQQTRAQVKLNSCEYFR